jgi:hypothetical protein
MPIELTEELVAAMAPVDKAILDGRELIKKGAFRALAKSEDGTLVFADCQGSGSSPYKVSLDLDTGGDRAARDVKLRGSRAGVLAVREAALYPGDVLNRRIRWDDKSADAVSERGRTGEDYAKLHAQAKSLEPAVKAFREQLKNPLAPQEAVVLLAAKRFGLTADDKLVMEDAAGARLVFRDPPEARYQTTGNLRHAAGAFGPGSLAVRLWFDPRERAIYGQALALVAGDKHLRLGI